MKFFVYIVESPSANDLYQGRTEADLLRKAIGLNQIKCASRTAISLEAFVKAIRVGLQEEMSANPGMVPILHVSAHGFSEGIQLSNGEIINWTGFRELLKPINQALGGTLFVCMSTCEGYSGSRMAMVLDDPDYPFFAIVGNSGKPTWSEAAVAFACFYHLVANGHYIVDAVPAMRVASGNDEFFVTTAEEAKQGYLDFVAKRQLDTQAAVSELQEDAKREPPNELAKRLRTPAHVSP
ncbi:MAG: hypothetical protein BGP23_03280 [Lysobacterales bacterium 66-474]|nr:MAG: hypothetical protein ABT18_07420 [Rhodanobacter sp. SCN 66-43]OJY86621.1 MAG: hypothetical protein BGP23_03280 [Xanthomonadales bacterium 66-474]